MKVIVIQILLELKIRLYKVITQTTTLLRSARKQKNLGDLRRLAITQTPVKDLQLKLMKKNSQTVKKKNP